MSSYSFDNYQRELATDLTLADLQTFTERFLAPAPPPAANARRHSWSSWCPMCSNRGGCRSATATRRSTASWRSADRRRVPGPGPPVRRCDAGVRRLYDFGGLTAIRQLKEPKLAGRSGFLFVFVVRQRITREDGDECLFHFQPVFVRADGKVDEEAADAAVSRSQPSDVSSSQGATPGPDAAFRKSQQYLEEKAGLWDWEDDVEFFGLSWVEFVH